MTIFALGATTVWPLGGAQTAAVGLSLVVIAGTSGLLVMRRRDLRWKLPRPVTPLLLVAVTALIVTTYFAVAALGPVTNYDSGLYHLGAIRYASEHPTVPGLANLYFPFGYGSAQFPLAALMTNGPWGLEGYRLLNGLVLAVASLDLVLRTLASRRGPGFYVLAVGLVATWVPMLALSDYWVTSPSQDSATLTLTVVASAYLADAICGRKDWLVSAGTGVAVGTVLTLIRPTMAAYFVGLLLVLGLLLVRRKPPLRVALVPIGIGLGLGAVSLVVATVRDRLLSGWAQYPLSAFPFNVPWRAADPTLAREATLGYHRNPDDLWNSVRGWEWVVPWMSNRLQQWETFELIALGAAALALLPVAMHRSQRRGEAARITLGLVPSVAAVVVWWVATPPSYRFAWGALFTIATVPVGWSLWIICRESKGVEGPVLLCPNILLSLVLIPAFLVTMYSALFRLDVSSITEPGVVKFGVSIPVRYAPVVSVPVSEVQLQSGLTLLRPTLSEQCWQQYPLCTPDPQSDLKPVRDQWPQGITTS